MRRTPHPLVLLMPLVATGLVACGGEAQRAPVREFSTPSVAQPPDTARVTDPDRVRYVRAVDRVCATYNPQRDSAVAEAAGSTDNDTAAKAYDDGITLADEQLKGIEAVAPPPRDRALIARNVVDRLRARLVLRRELRDDLAASDTAAAQQHRAQLDALTIALQAFARGYGFRVCGAK